MTPRIIKIDPDNIDPVLIEEAARVIISGGLVAFPTETVYGLGANALSPEAVSRIFEIKKRPLDDPLIVHISDKKDLYEFTEDVPREAEELIGRFWPGPLTLVLKKTGKVPDIVTAGLDTVAIRMPSGSIAQRLIEESGVPVAAPSANLFGRPSPTSAGHVIDDLGGDGVDLVVDGGDTDIGVESTVVEFTGGGITIIRPGGVSREELEAAVKKVRVYAGEESSGRSPGKYPRHYSPSAEVTVIEDDGKQVENALRMEAGYRKLGYKTGILSQKEHAAAYSGFNVKVLGPAGDGRACASRLFGALREFDADGVEFIIVEAVSEKGLGAAVMNRLRKAAG